MTRNRFIFLPAGILFGTILALGINSMAENSELDAGPRVFPYNGVLEFDGQAVDGSVDLRFTVTDEGDCLFEEEHDNVPVFSGRFTTNIGAVAGGVPPCVFDAEEAYIQVAVRAADQEEGEYVALLGQQRIHPVPFAYWAAEGSDMRIDGALNVFGNATITGTSTLTGDVGIGTAPGAAVVHIVGDDSAKPVFRAQQFSIDSEDGSGLINLVGGASADGDGGYVYHNNRGASRILLGDGTISFYTGLTADDGQGTGTAVDFSNPFNITSAGLDNPEGSLKINDTLFVNDSYTTFLTKSEDQSLTANGTLVLGNVTAANLTFDDNEIMARNNGANGTLFIQREGGTTQVDGPINLNGNIADTGGDVVIADGLVVTGGTRLRGNISDDQGNVTIDDSLDITGNIRDTNSNVIINDGLQVTGDLLHTGGKSTVTASDSNFDNAFIGRNSVDCGDRPITKIEWVRSTSGFDVRLRLRATCAGD